MPYCQIHLVSVKLWK